MLIVTYNLSLRCAQITAGKCLSHKQHKLVTDITSVYYDNFVPDITISHYLFEHDMCNYVS